jgi:F0F1-type ATP synthase membrane subunit b/b'
MKSSLKDQVAPHLNQVKAEGSARVQRLREIGTQSRQEAIAEVKAGLQSMRTIGQDALGVLKSTLSSNLQDAKTKGVSTAQSVAGDRLKQAKTYAESLDAQWTDKYGTTYIGLKQKLQQARVKYHEARQQQQAGAPSSYQVVQSDLQGQAGQAATFTVLKEEQIKQAVKALFQKITKR